MRKSDRKFHQNRCSFKENKEIDDKRSQLTLLLLVTLLRVNKQKHAAIMKKSNSNLSAETLIRVLNPKAESPIIHTIHTLTH